MPIPIPRGDETEENFLSRFMSNEDMIKDYPDENQRLAVAYQQWQNKKSIEIELEFKKYENINFKPTQTMARNAKRGLEMRKKQPPSNRGGTPVGLATARLLINREILSPKKVKDMYSFFSRHEVDKQSDSWKKGKSKGEQAWLLWGGDAGFSWSRKIRNQMEKEDSKKERDNIVIQHKIIDIDVLEVKQEGKKGLFKAYLNTYNKIDLGNDMTMPSFGEVNHGKKISLLKQHAQGSEHGCFTIIHDNKGMLMDGELYLEMIEGTDTPVFLEAHKTYSLLKRGVNGGVPVKFSMGYIVNPDGAEYETINGVQVRKLISGIVKEGSVVTFPMNPDSLQTSQVKSLDGGEELENEVKAMDMQQMISRRNVEEEMYNMKNAFSRSNREIMGSPVMTMQQKVEMIKKNCMYMYENYPKIAEQYMKMYHDENGMMRKEEYIDETKEVDKVEVKAGAKISKETKAYFMEGMGYMRRGMDHMYKLLDPEMLISPEKLKDPEGKKDADFENDKDCDNMKLEEKTIFESILNKLEGSE